VIKEIGYNDPETGFDHRSCAVVRTIHSQSADISQGVTETGSHEQGAGDQGLMFGFACRETKTLMPLPIYLAHRICERLAEARESGEVTWLRSDGKSQVTVEYREGKPHRIHTIVCSTQHTESKDCLGADGNMHDKGRKEIIEKIIRVAVERESKALWNNDIKFHINPTGRFVVGGPHGDTGLTGRKIIVDSYGGRGAHGGGAFSGKDPSKVDRSACYMARHVAKTVVASGVADVCEVQVAYAIGVADPVSVLVDTEGTAKVAEDKIADACRELFPMKPRGIIEYLKLRRPIYQKTARHGHFGREDPDFTWENTDKAADLAKLCGVPFKG
jgi:S-adenosylmethionine synthetase